MQLDPLYSTISRPVYRDSAGYRFIMVDCPECKGEGTHEFYATSSNDPSCRAKTCACEECGGFGQVYEEIEIEE